AEGDCPWLQLRDASDQLAPAPSWRLEPEAAGDGQPLHVHRAARVARAIADAGGLSAYRRRRALSGHHARVARSTRPAELSRMPTGFPPSRWGGRDGGRKARASRRLALPT